MKKILKIIMFVVAFFVVSENCFASTSYIKLGDQIPNVRLHLKTKSIEKNKNMYKIIKQDTGELVYCIEPGVMLYDGDFTEYNEILDVQVNITKEEWEYISLLAYYGYGYRDRTDIKWYVVTQYMIWDYLLDEGEEVYFIDEDDNKISLYDKEIAEIQKSVDSKNILPSFVSDSYDSEFYKLKKNQEITFIDENNVLDLYDITSSDKTKIEIDGNKLTLSFANLGEVFLSFRDEILSGKPKIYYNSSSQTVMSRGDISLPTGYLNFSVINPSLTVIKKSSEISLFSLEGATYGIYNLDGTLYDEIITDKNGVAVLSEIEEGEYYLKELVAPYGYVLSNEKTYFTITNEDLTLTVTNDLIKKEVKFIKYLVDLNSNQMLEEDAVFEIYNSETGELVDTIITDADGTDKTLLAYGKYKIVQIKGKEGYVNLPATTININSSTNKLIYKIYNIPIIGNLKITKVDSDTREIIEDVTKFQILNVDTGTYFKVNDNYTFETVNGVLYLERVPYGNYEIIEVESPINYQKREDAISFKIEKHGSITEIEVENEQIKKELKLEKYLLDSTGNLKFEENAKFEIYNLNTNSLVDVITTDKYGYSCVSLPYGKYNIVQVDGEKGYSFALDTVIEINNDYGDNILRMFNKEIVGNVLITKLDGDTKEIIKDVATFKILNKDTGRYYELNNKELFETIDGILYLENIPYGNYEIIEIDSPSGYEKSEKAISFVMLETGSVVDIKIENFKQKGTIKILKVDSISLKPLENILFGIYNDANELILEEYTDSNGVILIEDLDIGNYFIKEMLTHDDYELNDEVIKLEVKDNVVSNVTITNRMKIEVPKTGSKEFLITLLVSTFILLLGLIICNYGKKNN